jgi:biotin transport system ATP-binding protein
MKSTPLIEIKNLSHQFPDGNYGVREINLRIQKGELVLIAGKNGSGKTVLMKHLNGLLTPSQGEVFFQGDNIQKDLIKTRSQIGLVFQNSDNQIVGQTVEEDIAFGPENLNLPREKIKDKVAAALEITGIKHLKQKRPFLLSGGEKKKVAIAGILAMDPQVIILDEPFIGLDYPGVKAILKQILYLHKLDHTIIIISHDVEKILAHVDRLIIMEDGEIKDDNNPSAIINSLETFGIKNPINNGQKIEEMTWLK